MTHRKGNHRLEEERVMEGVVRRVLILIVGLIALVTALGGCNPSSEVDVPLTIMPTSEPALTIVAPSPEPPPPKSLVVCLNKEPASLYIYSDAYLYGHAGREANAVLQAIYDGPFDYIDYQVQPVILERIPNLSLNEDAILEEITVREGDLYLNPETLQPDLLKNGKPFMPSGCQGSTCAVDYAGGEVVMERLVIDFFIKPGLTWSDGEPLTASDSVFSYELDRHTDTPTSKYLVDRTFSYEVIGNGQSVRWVGIPGFLDSEYATNFWSPIPEHILDDYEPAELLKVQVANKPTIGWGAYTIEEWREGEQIVLRKNPLYHRASEGLPNFDFLIYRFLASDVSSAIQQVLTGECDLLDESLIYYEMLPDLLDLNRSGELKLLWGPGMETTRLDFNLAPVDALTESVGFSDARLRQAVASCINREEIVEQVMAGMGIVGDTYLSPVHPDYSSDLDPIEYDLEASIALLEQTGWTDDDGAAETPRVSLGVSGVGDGTPLSFTYLTTHGGFYDVLAESLQRDLAGCGIEMRVEYGTPERIKAPWPDGVIFGGGFQVVGWSWLNWINPLCEMFAGREIPSEENPFGSNASGFNHPDYNQACDRILLGLPDSQRYQDAVRITQEIFVSQLPALPLYLQPQFVVTSNEVCGIELDPLAFGVLWNLEAYDMGTACSG